jgi:nucleotide-binding universal stress UspA family protein
MQPILLAVDFSRSSRNAFHLALFLAKATRSTLRLVYVVPRSLASLSIEPSRYPSLAKRFEQELDDFVVEGLKGEPEDLPLIERVVLGGMEAEVIVQESDRCDAAMILMGTHGRSVLGRVFLGSVSSEVVRTAARPVLIVPEFARRSIHRIFAAVDRDGSTATVLETAASLSTLMEAQLTIAHVFDDRPEPFLYRFDLAAVAAEQLERNRVQALRELSDAVSQVFRGTPGPEVLLLNGKPEVEILREADDGAYDLVIVGTHERHEALDFANTTLRLVHRCPTAILVVRPSAQQTVASQTA